MKHILTVFFLLLPFSLCAEMEPLTAYTEDRYFVTTGVIDFEQSVDEVSIALLKYNEFSQWAFKGMDGVDKESEGLITYFTNIDYSTGENLFYVTFDINAIWPIGRKGYVMQFRPFQSYNNDGSLKSITLVPLLGTRMVEEANMIFYVEEKGVGTSLSYESRIKLSKFLDFFFSLRSYKRNFEWYVYKMSENLYGYLSEK